jgi:hypothetical protein
MTYAVRDIRTPFALTAWRQIKRPARRGAAFSQVPTGHGEQAESCVL